MFNSLSLQGGQLLLINHSGAMHVCREDLQLIPLTQLCINRAQHHQHGAVARRTPANMSERFQALLPLTIL